MLSPATGASLDFPEQPQRIDVDPLGDSLQALQGEVALTALDAPQVGPVHTEKIGELFLAQTARNPEQT